MADYGNLQTENIYGIPSDREKAIVKIKKLAKVKSIKLAKKNKDLRDKFSDFSLTLKKDELE